MVTFKSARRDLIIQGQAFHFISCKGRLANHQRAQLAYPAMWYLMVDGGRRPVIPCDATRSALELVAAFRDYAENNGLCGRDLPAEGGPRA